MIKIGCSGFLIAQSRYFSQFGVVEAIDFFDKTPLDKTVERWRSSAPASFEFISVCSKKVTHQEMKTPMKGPSFTSTAQGYFHDSDVVKNHFQSSLKRSQKLDSKVLLFLTPKGFIPHPDNVGRLQKFFKVKTTSALHYAWEAPRLWPVNLITSLSLSLGFTPVFNPLSWREMPKTPMRYFRLGAEGKTTGIGRFSDEDLHQIYSKCDKGLCYVIFNNGPTAVDDALRFSKLVKSKGIR
ncbi:MAG: DUF72 domain-containing protein [Elusimicrobiota bacterium]